MDLNQILSKKLGLSVTAMWFATNSDDWQEVFAVVIIAIVGIICQTILDKKQ